MGTRIQATQRGHDEHIQRWQRVELAELYAQYGDLQAQGPFIASQTFLPYEHKSLNPSEHR